MKVLISGSTGLVGSALIPFLQKQSHSVMRLVRSEPRGPEELRWDPQSGIANKQQLEGVDAVVHLAGESIAEGRWTAERKMRIRTSRVQGTRTLSESLAGLSNPPKVLVSGSAMGYYGNRGAEILREDSGPGAGFLAEVCQEWEAATQAASQKGIRVVHSRLGLVLSAKGGALKKMLLPFRLGIGGTIGSGGQYWSWIAIDDLVRVIHHLIMTESIQGAANACSPNPVTNAEFTETLGKVLKRPTIFPIPSVAARIAFGEMANEMLLSSTRMKPQVLLTSGYAFLYPDLEAALYRVLGV